MANWHELGDAAVRLLLKMMNGVCAVGSRLPSAVVRSRCGDPLLLAQRDTLGDAHVYVRGRALYRYPVV